MVDDIKTVIDMVVTAGNKVIDGFIQSQKAIIDFNLVILTKKQFDRNAEFIWQMFARKELNASVWELDSSNNDVQSEDFRAMMKIHEEEMVKRMTGLKDNKGKVMDEKQLVERYKKIGAPLRGLRLQCNFTEDKSLWDSISQKSDAWMYAVKDWMVAKRKEWKHAERLNENDPSQQIEEWCLAVVEDKDQNQLFLECLPAALTELQGPAVCHVCICMMYGSGCQSYQCMLHSQGNRVQASMSSESTSVAQGGGIPYRPSPNQRVTRCVEKARTGIRSGHSSAITSGCWNFPCSRSHQKRS